MKFTILLISLLNVTLVIAAPTQKDRFSVFKIKDIIVTLYPHVVRLNHLHPYPPTREAELGCIEGSGFNMVIYCTSAGCTDTKKGFFWDFRNWEECVVAKEALLKQMKLKGSACLVTRIYHVESNEYFRDAIIQDEEVCSYTDQALSNLPWPPKITW